MWAVIGHLQWRRTFSGEEPAVPDQPASDAEPSTPPTPREDRRNTDDQLITVAEPSPGALTSVHIPDADTPQGKEGQPAVAAPRHAARLLSRSVAVRLFGGLMIAAAIVLGALGASGQLTSSSKSAAAAPRAAQVQQVQLRAAGITSCSEWEAQSRQSYLAAVAKAAGVQESEVSASCHEPQPQSPATSSASPVIEVTISGVRQEEGGSSSAPISGEVLQQSIRAALSGAGLAPAALPAAQPSPQPCGAEEEEEGCQPEDSELWPTDWIVTDLVAPLSTPPLAALAPSGAEALSPSEDPAIVGAPAPLASPIAVVPAPTAPGIGTPAAGPSDIPGAASPTPAADGTTAPAPAQPSSSAAPASSPSVDEGDSPGRNPSDEAPAPALAPFEDAAAPAPSSFEGIADPSPFPSDNTAGPSPTPFDAAAAPTPSPSIAPSSDPAAMPPALAPFTAPAASPIPALPSPSLLSSPPQAPTPPMESSPSPSPVNASEPLENPWSRVLQGGRTFRKAPTVSLPVQINGTLDGKSTGAPRIYNCTNMGYNVETSLPGPLAYYKFQESRNTTRVVNTCGGAHDSVVLIYSAPQPKGLSNLKLLRCSDDDGTVNGPNDKFGCADTGPYDARTSKFAAGLSSYAAIDTTAGMWYYVVVADYHGQAANYTLNIY